MPSKAEELRRQGNELFCQGNWQKSIGKYSRCIRLLTTTNRSPSRSNNGGPAAEQQVDVLLAAYSNRAQARLNLGDHAGALEDTERALALDPAHVKSLLRRARALHGVELYQEAVAAYKAVLERTSPGLASVVADLERAETADKQSRMGVFELEEWWATDLQGTPPAVADFVGPVEVRLCCDGGDGGEAAAGSLGRGVFVTEDVKAGQLLFATRHTAVMPLRGPFTTADGMELVTRLLDAVRAAQGKVARGGRSFRDLQLLVQVHSMLQPCGSSTSAAAAVVTPMRFFKPVNTLSPADRQVTDADLAHPAVAARYTRADMAQIVNSRCFFIKDSEAAVHALGSLLNHSCLPNTEFRVQVGPVKMARAVRDQRAGAELRFAYTDTFCPLPDRRRTWATWPQPFVCACARCALEERLLDRVPALRALSARCSSMAAEVAAPDVPGNIHMMSPQDKWSLRKACVACIKRVERQLRGSPHCGGLDEQQRNWIRCSFLPFHKLVLRRSMVVALWEPGATVDDKLELRRLVLQAVVAIAAVDPGSRLATNFAGRELCASGLGRLEFDPKVEELVNRFGRITYGDGMDSRTYDNLLRCSAAIVRL